MKTHQLVALATVLALAACASPTTNDTGKTGGTNTGSAHDGTASAPVALTLGTPFSGKIGATSDLSNSESYYSFTTGTEGSALFAVNQASPAHLGSDDWDLRIYSDAAMTKQLALLSPNDNVSPYITGLSPSTTYFAKLFNKTSGATTYKVSASATPTYKHDGTVSPNFGPMILSFSGSTSTTSMVVTSLVGEEVSYYAFTAPASGTATIAYPEGILDGQLYTSQSYTGTPVGEESSLTAKSFTAPVTSGSGYYLKVKHSGTAPTRIMGTLTVNIQ